MSKAPHNRLEPSFRQTERFYGRLTLVALVTLTVFIGLCWGGRKYYVHWKGARLLNQARTALQKDDFRWASLAAQNAFQLDPRNVQAGQMLAELAEKRNDPSALDWRRRVVALEPGSLAPRLALCETALRFNYPVIAASTLAEISAPLRQDAAYETMAARVAVKQNDSTAAHTHFRAAARLAPRDPQLQLALADFELQSNDTAVCADGRRVATQMKSNSSVQCEALRLLTNDALRQKSPARAAVFAKELVALPAAALNDRLTAAALFHGLNDAQFTPALTKLEAECSGSVEQASHLIDWMNRQSLALVALEWSKKLPEKIRNALEVRVRLAESWLRLSDWAKLAAALKEGSWRGAEPLRLALSAKVHTEMGDDAAAIREWAEAVDQAAKRSDQLNVLKKLALEWHWTERADAILWSLAEKRDTEFSALETLYRSYSEQRDTFGLYRVLVRLAQVRPDNLRVKNNLVQVSLLLHTEPAAARKMARELHLLNPENGAYASTYAFALSQAGDFAAAIDIMRRLPPEQLRDPPTATYYGLILAGAGDATAAAPLLAQASKTRLLPEEETLVREANLALRGR